MRISKKQNIVLSQSGIFSLEFALVFPTFVLLLLFFFEICRLISVSSTIDLALAESGKASSRANISATTYKEYFVQHLNNNKQSLLSFFLPTVADDLIVNVTYCNSLADIINNRCDDNDTRSLAIYNINYNYKPIFILLPDFIMSNIEFNRKIVYVQEWAQLNNSN